MEYIIDTQKDGDLYKVVISRKSESKIELVGVPFRGTYKEVVRVKDALKFAFDFGRSATMQDIREYIFRLPSTTKDITPDEETLNALRRRS